MSVTPLDHEACHRAVRTRDVRFDGRFFGCVKTTGVYCRPVCPARTPRSENMIFVRSAAEAERLGFRACLRCRPETAPEMGAWRGTSNTVQRALALIDAGALDAGDVEALAERLGVGERHLRRLFRQHLGAAPVSVAQTRRVLLAKGLIHDSDLTMAEVAMAAGFGSVRRFNETFQALYGRPPSALRRRAERPDAGVRLSLAWRPPLDWPELMQALAEAGETVDGAIWRRELTPRDGARGWISAQVEGARLVVRCEPSDLTAVPGLLAQVRRLFDLSADPQAIAADLSSDPALAPLVAARPGLRLAGRWGAAPDHDPADDPTGLDPRLLARAEAWRPWRAYAARWLELAAVSASDVLEIEAPHDQAA